MNETSDDRVWEKGWDGHEVEQLRRLARLPFAVKLQWLEEASRLVRYLTESAASARATQSRDA
jgi:hypothetical protein